MAIAQSEAFQNETSAFKPGFKTVNQAIGTRLLVSAICILDNCVTLLMPGLYAVISHNEKNCLKRRNIWAMAIRHKKK